MYEYYVRNCTYMYMVRGYTFTIFIIFIFQNSSVDDALTNFFGIDIDFDSKEETSESIFLTLQNDLINFLLSKGCLIEDVRLLMGFYAEILKLTAGKLP